MPRAYATRSIGFRFFRTVMLVGCCGGLCAHASAASPATWFADQGTLHVELVTSVQQVDNVFLTATTPRSETIISVTPGVTFELRDRANFDGTFNVQQSFVAYLQDATEDDRLSSIQGSATWNGVRTQIDVDASFAQTRGNLRDFRSEFDLIRRDQTAAGLNLSYRLTGKTSLRSGISYQQEDSPTAGFHDTRDLTWPLAVVHALTPKINVDASYRTGRSDVDGPGGRDFRDQALGFGASGEFTPKVTGRFGANWTERRATVGSSEDLLGLDASLTWEAAPRLTCSASLARDFRASRDSGDTYTSTVGALGGAYVISSFWSAQFRGGCEFASYQLGRDDRLLTTELTIRYAPSLPLVISAGYEYEWNRSDVSFFDYEQNSFILSAAFRY